MRQSLKSDDVPRFDDCSDAELQLQAVKQDCKTGIKAIKVILSEYLGSMQNAVCSMKYALETLV
jgi:hypothetical protein